MNSSIRSRQPRIQRGRVQFAREVLTNGRSLNRRRNSEEKRRQPKESGAPALCVLVSQQEQTHRPVPGNLGVGGKPIGSVGYPPSFSMLMATCLLPPSFPFRSQDFR